MHYDGWIYRRHLGHVLRISQARVNAMKRLLWGTRIGRQNL